MRDKLLEELRPQLDLSTIDSGDIEAFQSTTLRPILKFQNNLTAQLLYSSDHFQKLIVKIDPSDPKAYSDKLAGFVRSNMVFKNKLLGVVLGMMTNAEFSFYNRHTTEINKRIIIMQIQRFIDNRK